MIMENVMQQFIYPAIFYVDGEETHVYFPDLDISTSGENFEDAFLFAKDLLRVYFLYAVTNDLDFNLPSDFESVRKKCGEGQTAILIDAIVTAVDLRNFKKSSK